MFCLFCSTSIVKLSRFEHCLAYDAILGHMRFNKMNYEHLSTLLMNYQLVKQHTT